MITNIWVNGFKSLVDFKMELQPGLNILVGPNGSGKTNIIQFFEFLRSLQKMSVSNAISAAGGVGMVFTKIGEDRFYEEMSAEVTGEWSDDSSNSAHYYYSIKITLSPELDRVIYYQQRLKIKMNAGVSTPADTAELYDLDIELIGGENPSATLHSLDESNIKAREVYLGAIKSTQSLKERLQDALDFPDQNQSLLSRISVIINDGYMIYIDLAGGRVYNIEPAKAKQPEDSATLPGIIKDGTGLYATLYAINKSEGKILLWRGIDNYPDSFFSFSNVKISDLIRYMKLSNDSIKGMEISSNSFDNQLQVRMTMCGPEKDTVLPLTAMSDGTIKWMVLITILLTNRHIFSIEEPENYLHPLLQAEILSVMRNIIQESQTVLMSTHSESLLNAAKPEEVIVVSFKDGKTIASRVSNADDLNSEIQRTGFGLGYYYIAGSLE